jgi:hypothetical protein
MEDAVTKTGAKLEDQPVRIICRFANGLMQSSVARSISLKGNVLSVQTRDSFEKGILVTVMASFLEKTHAAQVTSYKRGTEAGTFLMELALRPVAAPIVGKSSDIAESSDEVFRQAAGTLSKRLEAAGWIPYYQAAFEKATASERGPFLAATEMAVFTLLERDGMADASMLKALVERERK